MNHSWADGPGRSEDPGPSRGLYITQRVLVVLSGLVAMIWLGKVYLNQSESTCYENAPAGATVTTELRWFPPGYDCGYSIP